MNNVMLYIDMEINGVPLKAFVDCGAQSTLISKTCAERCGLLRFTDTCYKGTARAVGQSEILGRIHVAQIKIGQIFYPCSFLVLDSPNMELLYGLDMLQKHQCVIDLKENVLRAGGGEVTVPFLHEKDIPQNFHNEERHTREASSSAAFHSAGIVILYIDMEVNGVPLKTFVDSGSPFTIISKSCTERCGLLRLIDTRYKGIAGGAGQSEILGRIHVAPIKIGQIFYPCSFLVLDFPNMELLCGLDMLRKNQCIIDLKENILIGGGEVSVPFVNGNDIPHQIHNDERHAKEALISEAQSPAFDAEVAKLVELYRL